MASDRPWWHSAVFYQVYPRSFADSDGDGIGDLEGLRRRLPYLTWLGIDALWITPFFPSPHARLRLRRRRPPAASIRLFGYGCRGFERLHRARRTTADSEVDHRLRPQPHLRPASVVRRITFVAGAIRSATGTSGATRRRTARRPTTGCHYFGGSRLGVGCADTGQYYLHSFLREQPDLNWRNPEVREAMADVFRGWLDRGVDGFRIDAFRQLLKDSSWPDNPVNLVLVRGDGSLRPADSDPLDRPGRHRPRSSAS